MNNETEMAKVNQNTGLMQKVYAYLNGEKVGYGYFFYRDDGKMSGPDLYTPTGEKLDEGWYHIQVTDDSTLVVIPRTKQ